MRFSPAPVGAPRPRQTTDNNSHQNFSLTADQAAVIRSDDSLDWSLYIRFVKSVSQILGNIFHMNDFYHIQASK
jgi:hypothetical protein